MGVSGIAGSASTGSANGIYALKKAMQADQAKANVVEETLRKSDEAQSAAGTKGRRLDVWM